ncbi:hypothetical protein NST77_23270 [Niallia sp. FSL W8-0177]|uniref:hypothetical protein n=1 Tax=Niallia sp. FSL W8-0177 TaxID=2954522 RepID=UPI0030FAEC61
MYKKCNKCFYITELIDNKYNCINCNNSNIEETSSYPVPAALKFLDLIETNTYDLESHDVYIDLYYFEGFESSSIFLCATYEILLESLIYDRLKLMKTPRIVAELLLQSNQGQDKMGRLYTAIVEQGRNIKKLFKVIEQEEFYNLLYKFIKTRNQYIHGDPTAFKNSELDAED